MKKKFLQLKTNNMKKFIQKIKGFFAKANVSKSLFCPSRKAETEEEKYTRLEKKFGIFETEKVEGTITDEMICKCWSCEYIKDKGWDIFNLTEEQRLEVELYGQNNVC